MMRRSIGRIAPRVGAGTFSATSGGARSFVNATAGNTRTFTAQAHTQINNTARSESAHINAIRQNAETPLMHQYQRGGEAAENNIALFFACGAAIPLAFHLVGALWQHAEMEDGALDRGITHVAERVSSKLGDAASPTETLDGKGMKRKSSFVRTSSRKNMVAVPGAVSEPCLTGNLAPNGGNSQAQREMYINSVHKLDDAFVYNEDRKDDFDKRYPNRTGMSRGMSQGKK